MTKTCSYCKREFKTDQYVLLHQKTAKYCLKIQGEREIKYFCSFCNKSCTTKQNFENENLLSVTSFYFKYSRFSVLTY